MKREVQKNIKLRQLTLSKNDLQICTYLSVFGTAGDGRQGVVSILYVFVIGVIASTIPFTISTKIPLPLTVTDMKGGTKETRRYI